MTSRPGWGTQEPLHQRGNAGVSGAQPRGRSSRPVNNVDTQILASQDSHDFAPESSRRLAEDTLGRPRGPAHTITTKLASGDSKQTSSNDATRAVPSGKPQLLFHSVRIDFADAGLPSHFGPPAGAAQSLSLPPRPGHSRFSGPSVYQRLVPGGSGVKNAASRTAPGVGPPSPAQIFPAGKTADFFPWTGNHPEDTLSEALIKGGATNKSQIMSETNTARPSLWANLKSKSSLNSLSSLFVAVLEKRQACGRITAPNCFKPPPRLTLRDSTREAWLRDLANPAVGLRRLSRTIPHGITGAALLDHCLEKNIPVARAIWLTKCVGINEMRSHKRNRQAGTITWVRGWTSSVEHFLEGVIAGIGQPEWKPRVTYALQLAAALYQECLLEEDHFLDWVLKNLDSCPSERLFIWSMIAALFASGLAASRRRGKRYAEIIMQYAAKMYNEEEESQTASLVLGIEKQVIRLLLTRPACLLIPTSWKKHQPVLKLLAARHPHPAIMHTVHELGLRVSRLLSQPRIATSASDPSARLIALLDSVDYADNPDVESLALECAEQAAEPQARVATVLDWAASFYRDGSHRVYLATRMLRTWCRIGIDIDEAILSYLCSQRSTTGCDPRNIFRIIAELIRSKSFSVGKYLQWLIATGSAGQPRETSHAPLSPRCLINEMPLSGLSEQVRNLRDTLLRSTPYSAEEEERQKDRAEQIIRQHLADVFSKSSHDGHALQLDIAALSSTIKLELAYFLRHHVAASAEYSDGHVRDVSARDHTGACVLTARYFHVVRSYLETFGDLSILADVVDTVTMSRDSNVLASAADTVNYHFKSFSAIGAFRPLFGKITDSYAMIRTTKFPERELLLSLEDLSRRANATPNIKEAIASDLSRYDQRATIAACSPISDTMSEVFQDGATDIDDEIENVLSSGNSMDQHTMVRVFSKIINHMDEKIHKGTAASSNFANWLWRLRTFDEKAFGTALAEWLRTLLLNHESTLLHTAMQVLVVSGCITLLQFADLSRQMVQDRKTVDREMALQMSVNAFAALFPPKRLEPSSPSYGAYRYRLQQKKLGENPEDSILEFVREVIQIGAGPLSPPLESLFSGLLLCEHFRMLILRAAVKDVSAVISYLGIGSCPFTDAAYMSVKALLDSLLDPSGQLGLLRGSEQQQVMMIFDLVDRLSLSFCQLEVRHLLTRESADNDSCCAVSTTLLDAVKSSVEKGNHAWFELVDGLDSALISKVCGHAERELLDASSFVNDTSTSKNPRSEQEDKALISKYLTVVEATACSSSIEAQPGIFASLVERLKAIADAFERADGLTEQSAQTSSASANMSLTASVFLVRWLMALLRLALIHGSRPLHGIPTQQQVTLLWCLRQLSTCSALETQSSVKSFVIDTMMALHDSISDDARSHLARLDATKLSSNARNHFLFGSSPSAAGWLALTKSVPLATNTAASSIASSQMQTPSQPSGPQHFLQKRGPSAPPSGMLQRSMSQHQTAHQFQAPPAQNINRMYPPYPQQPSSAQFAQQAHQNKLFSQFQQRLQAQPNGPNMPYNQNLQQFQHMQQMQHMQQIHQMQQMQTLIQQRGSQPSPPVLAHPHMQRQQQQQATPTPQISQPPPGQQPAKAAPPKPEAAVETKTRPFVPKEWDMLSEIGANASANETALSLSLFAARQV